MRVIRINLNISTFYITKIIKIFENITVMHIILFNIIFVRDIPTRTVVTDYNNIHIL